MREIREMTYHERKAHNDMIKFSEELLYRLQDENDSFDIDNFYEELRDTKL